MVPLPPTPSEYRLLGSILAAAVKFEGQYPVEELKKRADLSAMNASQELVWGRLNTDCMMKRRAAGWQVGFCFTFWGATIWALWPIDITFHPEFHVVIEPQVLKSTSEERTKNPEAYGFWEPEDTPLELSPIPFIREYFMFVRKKFGDSAFTFAPKCHKPDTAEFITSEINSLAKAMKLEPPPGLKFTSHGLHRGMLSVFVL